MNILDALIQGWKDTKYFRGGVYPTTENITEILAWAAKYNPLYDNLRASYRTNIFDNSMRELKIYGNATQVVYALSTSKEMTLKNLLPHLARGLSDNASKITQPELPLTVKDIVSNHISKRRKDYKRKNELALYTDWHKEPVVPLFPKPVTFDIKAYAKFFSVIDYFTAKGTEVGFYGTITEQEDRFVVEDVDVPVQSARACDYFIPASSLYGVKFTNNRDWESVNCMLHSHANMGVFFSGSDEQDFAESFQGVAPTGFYMSIVGNKRRELYGKIFTGKDRKEYEVRFIKPTIPVNPYVYTIVNRVKLGGNNGVQSYRNLSVPKKDPEQIVEQPAVCEE